MAIHSSTLTLRIPWKEEPGRLQSMGSQRVRHDWATFLPSFLPHCRQTLYCLSYQRSQWCHPSISSSVAPLLLSSISPSIRVFSNESALPIRWPKYWSFSFSISSSDEYSGLVSFRIAWIDLLDVQGTLKSILQHPSLKASILWGSAFFKVQLSHPKTNLKNTWFWFNCLYDCWFVCVCVCVCV